MITSISIKNYKRFESFKLECKNGLNLIVGNNDAGKSTLLEAISLGLTKRLNGRPIEYELSQHLFNAKAVKQYLESIAAGDNVDPPRIIIELTFAECDLVAGMKGSNNTGRVDAFGLRLVISLDDDPDVRAEYTLLLERRSDITALPVEYYKVAWYTFADKALTGRNMPVKSSFIDATSIRVQSGTTYYLGNAIQESLSDKERLALAWEYRRLKPNFAAQAGIKSLNDSLKNRHVSLNDATLTVSMDMSQRAPWETNLTPHLDDLPMQFAGKGEQHFLKIMFALDREAADCHVVLVEEPENHLAFSYLNVLLNRIDEKCQGRQVFIATHSAFVLNKLGLDRTTLLGQGTPVFLTDLPPTTQSYFRRLPGYDTLRLLLAKRTVLVEGPSDELFFQKAYRQGKGHLPIADGVDVLSVRGTSAPRFLDVAKAVGHPADVIADNDGDYERRVRARYATYVGGRIRVFADEDNSRGTLEYHVAALNSVELLNRVFGTTCATEDEVRKYMLHNKTEWALAAFDSPDTMNIPAYIQQALAE
jgi:putative ATP-dependent endonuclease of the OLD family